MIQQIKAINGEIGTTYTYTRRFRVEKYHIKFFLKKSLYRLTGRFEMEEGGINELKIEQ